MVGGAGGLSPCCKPSNMAVKEVSAAAERLLASDLRLAVYQAKAITDSSFCRLVSLEEDIRVGLLLEWHSTMARYPLVDGFAVLWAELANARHTVQQMFERLGFEGSAEMAHYAKEFSVQQLLGEPKL